MNIICTVPSSIRGGSSSNTQRAFWRCLRNTNHNDNNSRSTNKMLFLIVFVVVVMIHSNISAEAFHWDSKDNNHHRLSYYNAVVQQRQRQQQQQPSVMIFSSSPPSYGRGADIWPECNEEPVKLEDSFPDGKIPDFVRNTLLLSNNNNNNGNENDPTTTTTIKDRQQKRKKRDRILTPISRILRQAATSQGDKYQEIPSNASLSRTPGLIAMFLLLKGLVRPLDVLIVSFLSGYFLILGFWAKSTRPITTTTTTATTTYYSTPPQPYVPSLPPQGHVPAHVANPLGYDFTYSSAYDTWLKLGAYLGLLAPLFHLVLKFAAASNTATIATAGATAATSEALLLASNRACARSIFLLCCQAVSEGVSRRVLTPLPLRILIPVAYNTIRIGYLWNWCSCPYPLGKMGRFLAVSNFFFWSANLFAFLLPVATMRYMRAYFFCVEAEQVNTRPGMEESLGL